MRPPYCAICDKIITENEGGLLSFKLTEKEAKHNKRFEEEGFVGHPDGLEWFCGKHYAKAKDLTHLSLSEALECIV